MDTRTGQQAMASTIFNWPVLSDSYSPWWPELKCLRFLQLLKTNCTKCIQILPIASNLVNPLPMRMLNIVNVTVVQQIMLWSKFVMKQIWRVFFCKMYSLKWGCWAEGHRSRLDLVWGKRPAILLAVSPLNMLSAIITVQNLACTIWFWPVFFIKYKPTWPVPSETSVHHWLPTMK